MDNFKCLWQTSAPQSTLDSLAQQVVAALNTVEPFCLWLEGEMGSGKTTLAGAILRALGLPPQIPVTSPTYAYLNEYQIGDRHYAHMDLFRVKPDFPLEDLGILDDQVYAGLLVEWPQVSNVIPQQLQATHRLMLSYSENDNTLGRRYAFYTRLT